MAIEQTKMILIRGDERFIATFVWTISKARDTYGYNVVTAYVDGERVGKANGGGYDMQGAALSGWVASMVSPDAEFYGLTWHDPNYKTPKHIEEAEQAGESLGLERYQAVYKASSPKRTERHTIPSIDGACGLDTILNGAGFKRWEVNEWSQKDVEKFIKNYGERGENESFEQAARRKGFRRSDKRTRGGGMIWERWPEESWERSAKLN